MVFLKFLDQIPKNPKVFFGIFFQNSKIPEIFGETDEFFGILEFGKTQCFFGILKNSKKKPRFF